MAASSISVLFQGLMVGLFRVKMIVRAVRVLPIRLQGAVIALTKWVAKELGGHGITCNSVAPGATATGITAGVAYDLSQRL